MKKITYLIMFLLMLSTGYAQTTSHWGRTFKNAAGVVRSGLNIDLYAAGGAKVYDLVESSSLPGYYYFDTISTGDYDVYINGVKTYSNVWIGTKKLTSIEAKFNSNAELETSGIQTYAVTNPKIADDAITTTKLYNSAVTGGKVLDSTLTKAKMTIAFLNWIDASGGGSVTNNPDDETIINVGASQLGVNPAWLDTTGTLWKLYGTPDSSGIDSVGVYQHTLNSNIYNVKDYAVGNGTTLDTAPFQAAIDAAPDNAIIDLGGFTYLTGTLNISSREGITLRNGILKLHSGSNYILYLLNSSNIKLENITIDNQSTGNLFVDINACSNVELEKCIFKNLGNGSVSVYGVRIYGASENIKINKNSFINANSSGVSRFIFVNNVLGSLSKNIRIINNSFDTILPKSDGDAIQIASTVSGKANVIIASNVFKDCAKRYIKTSAEGVSIKNNIGYDSTLTVSDSMFSCVSVYRGDANVSDNEFYFTGTRGCMYGIDIGSADSVSNISVINNKFMSGKVYNSSTGCRLVSTGSNIKIIYNTFKNFKYGVQGYNNKDFYDLSINDNTFANNTDYPIWLNGSVLTGNFNSNIQTSSADLGRYFIYFFGTSADSISNISILGNRHRCTWGTSSIVTTKGAIFNQIANTNVSGSDIDWINGSRVAYRTYAPTSGTWVAGDKVYNTNPSAGYPFAWFCTVGGTPGTWVAIAQQGYRVHNASPVGLLAPRYIGEEFLDTTNSNWYKATGTGSSDWKQISN